MNTIKKAFKLCVLFVFAAMAVNAQNTAKDAKQSSGAKPLIITQDAFDKLVPERQQYVLQNPDKFTLVKKAPESSNKTAPESKGTVKKIDPAVLSNKKSSSN